MAETKAPARKSRTKTIVKEIEQEYTDVKAEVEAGVKSLEGKTVPELRVLHDEALWAESEAKRRVHILRQQAANLATDADTKAEEAVIAAKQELAKAEQRLRQVENALEGQFKDLYGVSKYGD